MYTLLVLISIIQLPLLTLESELGPYMRAYLVISIFQSTHATSPQDMETVVEVMAVVFRDVTIPEGAARSVCVCVYVCVCVCVCVCVFVCVCVVDMTTQ